MRRAAIAAIGLAVWGCSKASDAPAPDGPKTRIPTPSAIAPLADAASTPAAPGTWTGHYAASPGSFSVPDGGEWAGVKFRGDVTGDALGEGTLRVSVDSTGRVSGTLEGPLGALRVTGELVEGAFSAALVPSDPGHGFSGVAVGSAATGVITGTMRLSLPTGNVLREASFTLERTR